MDVLKSLIAKQQAEKDKLKERVEPSAVTKNGKKYIRRGDIDRVVEEERRKELEEEILLKQQQEPTSQQHLPEKHVEMKRKQRIEDIQMTLMQIIAALRQLGQPITLFGESQMDRYERLQQAKHDSIASDTRELDVDAGHSIRNQFLEKEMVDEEEEQEEEEQEEEEEDHVQTDAQLIYRFFRKMLKSWINDLARRPDEVKRTAQGKLATKTMKQCKDYIRPLFKLCRREQVPINILPKLVEIVKHCQAREFVRANDAYIGLAIGNAAWPIGVTMVGIHERTGREKINSNKQAHVMNNELQRKYLTSVKRLISYCQNTSDSLPSQRVS